MSNQTPELTSSKPRSYEKSVTTKLIIIGVLVFFLMVPIFMIMMLIDDRELTKFHAVNEVASKWSGAQTIAGPILSIPYKTYIQVKENEGKEEVVQTVKYAYFLPEDLVVNGELLPEVLYRGIFEVLLYSSQLEFSGSFKNISLARWDIPESDILWDDAIISIGIPDMRGINENVVIVWNSKKHSLNPGLVTQDILSSGLSANVPINSSNQDEIYKFSFELDLNGSEIIKFVPVGKVTDITLSSTWNTPSFDGSFLPDKREVDNQGFNANWKVLSLNRNYPQMWLGKTDGTSSKDYNVNPLYNSAFGVKLIFPTDNYQKTMRSAKYAFILISLTFAIFFFVEIFYKVRVHFIQYLLVGFALCVFYTLLLSLSEQTTFPQAYLISSLAIIALITSYTYMVFRINIVTYVMALVLSFLYLFFYVLLQIQDYTLLVGSIGLFIIIAVVMYLSTKIDWYSTEDS